MTAAQSSFNPISASVSPETLVQAIRFLHAQGWTPATSSNFSYRLDEPEQGFAVSISGLDKGKLTPNDFLNVDWAGKTTRPEQAHCKPSAETLLHALVYRRQPQANVVLHTHSVNGTVLSKLFERQGGIWLKNFEILKGLAGIQTHDISVHLPIFGNQQDITSLAQEIEPTFEREKTIYGFLLAGHGLYTWGATVAEAQCHVEVFEFLFECILKLRQYGDSDYS